MSALISFLIALVIGIGLGVVYFGGLWLTVRKLPVTNHPILLSLGSFLGRIAFVTVGFYLIIVRSPNYAPFDLMACLFTFFWVRNILVKRLKPIRGISH